MVAVTINISFITVQYTKCVFDKASMKEKAETIRRSITIVTHLYNLQTGTSCNGIGEQNQLPHVFFFKIYPTYFNWIQALLFSFIVQNYVVKRH